MISICYKRAKGLGMMRSETLDEYGMAKAFWKLDHRTVRLGIKVVIEHHIA